MDQVEYVTKTRKDNDVTKYTGTIYVEIYTQLLGPIGVGKVFYENQARQRCDILQVRPTLKRKLSCHDRSNQLRTIMKTKPDSGMTDHKGAANVEIKIELS